MNETAPGITRNEYDWGYHIEGEKAALIAAGIAQEAWFPNGLERNARGKIIRTRELTRDGRRIRVRQDGRGQWFEIYFYFTEEEREKNIRNQEFEKAKAYAERELAFVNMDADGYRKDHAEFAGRHLHAIIQSCADNKYTAYRLHPDTISELQRIAGHFLNAIENGKVLFSRAAKASREFEIRSTLAKADPALQRFMRAVDHS